MLLIVVSVINLAILVFLLYKIFSFRSVIRQLFEGDFEKIIFKLDTKKILLEALEKNNKLDFDSLKTSFNTKLDQTRQELNESLRTSLKDTAEALTKHVRDLSESQREQLKTLNESSRHDLQQIRQTLEASVKNLQEDNSKKLEEMRLVVDEKLQSTLEKRLESSFKQVSERLEKVHQGLGEMQSLATGVGDLKKVLVNVKTRGNWGEMQLASLLEDIMSPEQYQANVAIKLRSQERVDFAIKLPGDKDSNEPVWLPIDAKFPQEDYQKLLEAQEASDLSRVDQFARELENRIKLEARSIRDKYISPPQSTDFALMFLPTEGLYAEVIRRPGLIDKLQKECRVNVVGPTTLAALLNSLQLGFRTLTIQKRTSEVQKLLADISKQFGTFGELLDKAHERVEQAGKVIQDASSRSKLIEGKLKKVQELPGSTEPRMVESAQLN